MEETCGEANLGLKLRLLFFLARVCSILPAVCFRQTIGHVRIQRAHHTTIEGPEVSGQSL